MVNNVHELGERQSRGAHKCARNWKCARRAVHLSQKHLHFGMVLFETTLKDFGKWGGGSYGTELEIIVYILAALYFCLVIVPIAQLGRIHFR